MLHPRYRKLANSTELIIYEVLLPALRAKCNGCFVILQLPETLRVNRRKKWVEMPFYEGTRFDNRWHEQDARTAGGRALGLCLANEMALLLKDFAKIDTNWISQTLNSAGVRSFLFDPHGWLRLFDERAPQFVAKKLLTTREIDAARGIVRGGYEHSRLVFSNGDFYPRNLIAVGERIVVVDWQGRETDYRVRVLDYLENLVAFAFIHMWANGPWQAQFLREVRKHFNLSCSDFQRALLVKSFDQAYFWKEEAELVACQMEIFRQALDINFVPGLFV
jgi:hypothetical protein